MIKTVVPTMSGLAPKSVRHRRSLRTTTGWLARRHLVGRLQDAAALGADAEHVEVVPGDQLARHLAGAAPSPERDGGQGRAEEPGKRPVVLAQLDVVGIRHAEGPPGAGLAVDDVEAGRPVHASERGERDALEHGEDGGVHADAEREHADDGRRERLVLQERTDGIAEVAGQIAHGLEPPGRPHPARGLGGERDVAEVLQRRVVRGFPIGALGHPLGLGHRQVRADFVAGSRLHREPIGGGAPTTGRVGR